MIDKSEQLGELAKALSLVQKELRGAVKDSANPFFKSKYADLESVWEAARGPLTNHGFAVSQTTDFDEIRSFVCTWLLHSSGQFLTSRTPIIASKNDAQSMGAAITYARRFALAAIVGIIQVDDDGETAIGRGVAAKEAPPVKKDPRDDFPPPVWESIEEKASGMPGDYVIRIGKKYVNKKLRDVSDQDIFGFRNWLKDKANKEGKPIVGLAKEFIDNAEAWLQIGAHLKER